MSSPTENALLEAVCSLYSLNEDSTVSDLAHKLGCSDTTVRRRAKKLVSQGLLYTSSALIGHSRQRARGREAEGQRTRAAFYYPTTSGHARLVEIEKVRAPITEATLDAMAREIQAQGYWGGGDPELGHYELLTTCGAVMAPMCDNYAKPIRVLTLTALLDEVREVFNHLRPEGLPDGVAWEGFNLTLRWVPAKKKRKKSKKKSKKRKR